MDPEETTEEVQDETSVAEAKKRSENAPGVGKLTDNRVLSIIEEKKKNV